MAFQAPEIFSPVFDLDFTALLFFVFLIIFLLCCLKHTADWFHGDALDLKMEQINRLIGFKCHKCLKKIPSCCPHLHATRIEGANLVGLDNNEGIDSIHEETSFPPLLSEASVEQDFELDEESKKLSLVGDHDERQPLETTFGSNEMLKSDAENGQLHPSSAQKAEVQEFSNDDGRHPDELMASKGDNLLQKDAVILDESPAGSITPVETESLLCKSNEDVSEKDLTSLMHNHVKNGLLNQQSIFHSVVNEAFDSAE